MKGRKKHIMVDTLGFLLTVVVHPANMQDRDGAKLVFTKAKKEGLFKTIELIWADGGYAGKLITWVKRYCCKRVLEIVKRTDDMKGFVVLPKRWIVERTFGWIGRYRRMSKDYEELPESTEIWIYIAMINLMVHRLKPD